MATATEGKYAGEFLVADDGEASREAITVLSGQNLVAGAVIGRVSRGIGRVSVPTVVGTGNGTASLVTVGPEAEVGSYVVTCTATATNGGTFSVTTPSGKSLPALVLTAGAGAATAYVSRHINFTITDGSTDFAAGDSFTFVVSTTAPTVLGTGNGTISALALGPMAKPGTYRVVCTAATTNGGTFRVVTPDGDSMDESFVLTAGSGNTTAFSTPQIGFSITDGSTDFAAGDYFNVAVYNQLAGGKVVEWDPRTYDGRHRAAGIAWDNYDASTADVRGVIEARAAIVNAAELAWKTGLTTAEQDSGKAELAALGIIAR